MRKTSLLTVLVAGVLGGTTILVSWVNRQEPSGVLSQKEAVALIRRVNTAEASAWLKRGTYLSLEKLLQDPAILGPQAVTLLMDAQSATVQDYKLWLLLSPDGKHYGAALAPRGCGPAVFSSESAVIYVGQALGCVVSP